MPGRLTWPLTQNSFGPGVLLRADGREPCRAALDDRRHVAHRLDVVDHGRAAVEADHGRERRLDARLRPLPFERLDQRGLFARLVGAGAAVHVDLAVLAAAEDVLPQVAGGAGLGDLGLELPLQVVELAADVDVADLGADRPAADDAAFEQQVRVALEQHVILERARLALVGVDQQVLRLGDVLRDEAPLHAGREAGAAAAAQAGLLHLVDDRLGRHRHGLAHGLVAAVLDVEIERVGAGLLHVARQDGLELGHGRCLRNERRASAAPARRRARGGSRTGRSGRAGAGLPGTAARPRAAGAPASARC